MLLRLPFVLLLAALEPALAQVEKVTIPTTGISCGVCAVVSEIQFRRIAGVEAVKISLSTETVVLSYEPGATFAGLPIRQVLQPLGVGVLRFEVSALGRIEQQGEKRYFVAGKNRFAVVPPASGNAVRAGAPASVVGIVDDQKDPPELKILSFKLLGSSGVPAPNGRE